jgi:ATP-dependent helicase/nuclease subunit A
LQEAIWAADTIRGLVEGTADAKPYLVTEPDGSLRPIRYRDCAILLRATSQSAQIYVEEFALQGMPLFSDTGAGYFASVEVGVVLSFLQVLDNPRQDIPLAAVLRSPLYNWGETMLAQVRQAAPEEDFLDAVSAHAGVYADACARFLEDLEMWRERARMMPVSDLLEAMYAQTGYALHVTGLPQGQRRLANLRLLVDRAARFESAGFRGLFGFIRYVERLRLAKGDLDGAKIIGEGEDVVRLMSIHKSKGLEFPVVLLCGAGKRFNLMDRNRRVLMHHRHGLGPDAVLPESGAIWATAAKHALSAVSLREMLSEEMRILYVAMTRARERLFVCGRLRNLEQTLAKAADLPGTGELSPGTVLPLRSHAHWLLAAWYPLFQDPQGPVRLVMPDLDRLLAARTAVLAAGRSTVASVLAPLADAQHAAQQAARVPGVRETAGIPEGQISLFEPAGVPEGQISLFDGTDGAEAQSVLTRNLAEARRRLAWQAPFPKLSTLPSKLSVTALKRLWDEQDEASARLEEAFRIACTSPEEVASFQDGPDSGPWTEGMAQAGAGQADDGMFAGTIQTGLELQAGAPQADAAMPVDVQEEAYVLPSFMRQGEAGQQRLAGFEYGTLMHLVLQHLDPVPGGLPDVEGTISGLVARGLIPQDKAHWPNRAMLRAFVCSELFARMTRVGRVYRETPFTILMPAADVLRDTGIPANEQVVMQGIVDCWFVEEGRIVLVDYKTDRTLDRVPAYRRQLAWYAAALEKTTGLPVKEQILWFLRPGIAV